MYHQSLLYENKRISCDNIYDKYMEQLITENTFLRKISNNITNIGNKECNCRQRSYSNGNNYNGNENNDLRLKAESDSESENEFDKFMGKVKKNGKFSLHKRNDTQEELKSTLKKINNMDIKNFPNIPNKNVEDDFFEISYCDEETPSKDLTSTNSSIVLKSSENISSSLNSTLKKIDHKNHSKGFVNITEDLNNSSYTGNKTLPKNTNIITKNPHNHKYLFYNTPRSKQTK
jgi:hypothetical protein